MAVLEVWLLASTVAGIEPSIPPESEPPPVELLEFLGDWGKEEARLIDGYRPAQKAPDTEGKSDGKDKKKGK